MITNALVTPQGKRISFHAELLANGELPNGEWLIIYNSNSTFYYICNHECDFEVYCAQYGWYIISSYPFNDNCNIGVGFINDSLVEGHFYQVANEEKLKFWTDLLKFTFNGENKELFVPYDNYFNGRIKIDDSWCLYIHDYIPVHSDPKADVCQKKIRNLVFKLKKGEYTPLLTKTFS